MSTSSTTQGQVTRLIAFGKQVRRELLLGAGRRLLALVLIALVTSLALDRWLRFGAGTLDVLRVALLVGLGYATWRALGGLVRERPSVLGWASLVDRGVGAGAFLTQRFATLLQLEERAAQEPLARAAIDGCRADLAAYDYEGKLDRAVARQERRRLAGLVALPVVFCLVFPGTAGTWAKRWLFGSEAAWPQATHLALEGLRDDGSFVVPRGEPLELRVHATRDSVVPAEISLRYSAGGQSDRAVMTRFGENDFRFSLPGLAEDGRLWIRGGDEGLGPIPLRVRDRPRVLEATLTARLTEAGFEETSTFARQDEELGYLGGTALALDARTDQPLAELRIAGGEGLDLQRSGPIGPSFALAWTHTRAASLRLEFVSSATGLASHPWSLAIALREDRAPRVTLARDGVRDRVTPEARVPARIVAQDDYGVAGISLALTPGGFGLSEGEPLWSRVLFDGEGELQDSVELEESVSLAELGLEVGQVVQLVASVTDASHLGAQETRSRPVVLRIVDPGQLMAEISARLQLARARLRKGWEEARELEDELQRGEPVANVAEMLRKHRVIDRTVWQTRRVLDDSLRELTLNALISEQAETLLRQRAMEPMQYLAEDWMRDQRTDLERRIAGEDISAAALLRTQSLIVEDMQRVLDGMAQWDSFVDVVNHLNEIIRLEEEVRGATRDSR